MQGVAMIRLLCLSILIAACLRADIYEVVNVTERSSKHVETTYEYASHGSVRLQQIGCFRNTHVRIWNEIRKSFYELDPDAHEYVEPQQTDPILFLAQWIRRPHNLDKTVDIYYETIDTGERRQILGRTARRLLFRERHVAAPGACMKSSVTEDNGWYIAFPEQSPASSFRTTISQRFVSYDSDDVCPDRVVKHGEPSPPGLLVLQEKDTYVVEVIALSASPLDKGLFEVPPNYKKVEHFAGQIPSTWAYLLSWKLNRLRDSVLTWF